MADPDIRDDLDLDAIRAALEREKAALTEERAASATARAPVALDQQSVGRLSRMDAMQVQAMAQAVDARRHTRLRRIEATLARLSAGDYGFCVRCDEPVAAKRLALDPAAPLCIACAEAR